MKPTIDTKYRGGVVRQSQKLVKVGAGAVAEDDQDVSGWSDSRLGGPVSFLNSGDASFLAVGQSVQAILCPPSFLLNHDREDLPALYLYDTRHRQFSSELRVLGTPEVVPDVQQTCRKLKSFRAGRGATGHQPHLLPSPKHTGPTAADDGSRTVLHLCRSRSDETCGAFCRRQSHHGPREARRRRVSHDGSY